MQKEEKACANAREERKGHGYMLGKKGFASEHKLSLSHGPFSKVLQKKKKKKMHANIRIHRQVRETHVYLCVT